MNELLKIEINENQEQVVSGRLLHQFLGINTRYNDWFNRMLEFEFVEGKDFYSILSKTPNGGRPSTDHILKLSMAKELCMLARNEKGKQARLYFIKCEEAWNSPQSIMNRAVILANAQLKLANEKVLQLTAENEAMKPKADYFDELVDRNTLTNFRETAKLLHKGQKFFINWLLDRKFVFRNTKGKLQPYAQFIANADNSKGYFEVKEQKSNYGDWSGIQTLITPRGREAFRLLLEK